MPTQVYKTRSCFSTRQLSFSHERHSATWQNVHLSHVTVALGYPQFQGIEVSQTLVLAHCPCTLACRGWPSSNLGAGPMKDAAARSCSNTRPFQISLSSSRPPPSPKDIWESSYIVPCALWCRTLGGSVRPICLTTQPFLSQGLYFLYILSGRRGIGFPRDGLLPATWIFCDSLLLPSPPA